MKDQYPKEEAAKQFNLTNYQHPDKFGDWLGYRVHKLNRETHEVELDLTIREDHLSPAGRVHGGVVSSFFDFACGGAVFTTLDANDGLLSSAVRSALQARSRAVEGRSAAHLR